MEFQVTSDKYIVFKNEDSSILHLTFVTSGSKCATGQPIVEQFDTLEDATAYIDAIKGDWYTRENYKEFFETPEQPA